jgi:hypothetical protein
MSGVSSLGKVGFGMVCKVKGSQKSVHHMLSIVKTGNEANPGDNTLSALSFLRLDGEKNVIKEHQIHNKTLLQLSSSIDDPQYKEGDRLQNKQVNSKKNNGNYSLIENRKSYMRPLRKQLRKKLRDKDHSTGDERGNMVRYRRQLLHVLNRESSYSTSTESSSVLPNLSSSNPPKPPSSLLSYEESSVSSPKLQSETQEKSESSFLSTSPFPLSISTADSKRESSSENEVSTALKNDWTELFDTSLTPSLATQSESTTVIITSPNNEDSGGGDAGAEGSFFTTLNMPYDLENNESMGINISNSRSSTTEAIPGTFTVSIDSEGKPQEVELSTPSRSSPLNQSINLETGGVSSTLESKGSDLIEDLSLSTLPTTTNIPQAESETKESNANTTSEAMVTTQIPTDEMRTPNSEMYMSPYTKTTENFGSTSSDTTEEESPTPMIESQEELFTATTFGVITDESTTTMQMSTAASSSLQTVDNGDQITKFTHVNELLVTPTKGNAAQTVSSNSSLSPSTSQHTTETDPDAATVTIPNSSTIQPEFTGESTTVVISTKSVHSEWTEQISNFGSTPEPSKEVYESSPETVLFSTKSIDSTTTEVFSATTEIPNSVGEIETTQLVIISSTDTSMEVPVSTSVSFYSLGDNTTAATIISIPSQDGSGLTEGLTSSSTTVQIESSTYYSTLVAERDKDDSENKAVVITPSSTDTTVSTLTPDGESTTMKSPSDTNDMALGSDGQATKTEQLSLTDTTQMEMELSSIKAADQSATATLDMTDKSTQPRNNDGGESPTTFTTELTSVIESIESTQTEQEMLPTSVEPSADGVAQIASSSASALDSPTADVVATESPLPLTTVSANEVTGDTGEITTSNSDDSSHQSALLNEVPPNKEGNEISTIPIDQPVESTTTFTLMISSTDSTSPTPIVENDGNKAESPSVSYTSQLSDAIDSVTNSGDSSTTTPILNEMDHELTTPSLSETSSPLPKFASSSSITSQPQPLPSFTTDLTVTDSSKLTEIPITTIISSETHTITAESGTPPSPVISSTASFTEATSSNNPTITSTLSGIKDVTASSSEETAGGATTFMPIMTSSSSPGNEDDDNLLCDDSSWLECDMNESRCKCQDGMVFDKEHTSCVSLAGKDCYLKGGNGQTRGCTMNAECSAKEIGVQGECKCTDGFLASTEGFCLPGFDMPCKDQNSANNSSVCHANLECSVNSKKCVCKEGFSPGKPGSHECLLDHNGNCSGQNRDKCNSYAFLNCSGEGNLCLCGDEKYRVYDAERKVCVSTAGTGSQCGLKEDMDGRRLGCVADAVCKAKDDLTTLNMGVCECNDGFENSLYGYCAEKNSARGIHTVCFVGYFWNMLVMFMLMTVVYRCGIIDY